MISAEEWAVEQKKLLTGIPATELLANPFLFIGRLKWTKWLSRIDLFRQIIEVPGSIVECGVRDGASLMAYYQMIGILEPANINRQIVGFDTFSGFPSTSASDPEKAAVGDESGLIAPSRINEWVNLQNLQRMVPFTDQVELVEGDACETIPSYVDSRPDLGIAMLVLDFDLYEPTRVALEHFLPLIPAGGIVVFDELLNRRWPGETLAFKDELVLGDVSLRKFAYEAHTTYFVVQP